MLTKDFNFYLPDNLIAQYPSDKRGLDKLLILERETGKIIDTDFAQLSDFIPENTLMIFNNSKVRKARIFGKTNSNSQKNEFLLIKPIDDGYLWQVMVKHAKRQKSGKTFTFDDGTKAEIIEHPINESGGFRCLKFDKKIDDKWLDLHGHIPLPPYIKREDTEDDSERYQTVYAEIYGSIAAPTAGLHFTQTLLQKLKDKGVETAEVTLHVGLGTFLPVRSEHIENHKMHTESFFISEKTALAVQKAFAEKRPILAVGTTSVRTLESAWDSETQVLKSGYGKTNIFIYPPYKFKIVNMLLTNFHTPESSLVMLVSAFASKEKILTAYKHAVDMC